jgi:hypothetical protein
VTRIAGIVNTPYDIVTVFAIMLIVALLASIVAALWYRYFLLALLLMVLLAGIGGVGYLVWANGFFDQGFNGSHARLLAFTNAAFAPVLAAMAATILMKFWGRMAFLLTYILSLAFFGIYLFVVWKCAESDATGWAKVLAIVYSGNWPWSLPSQWSLIAAWTIIGIYLAINAAFLQPYLGDAARYFRNSPANVAVRREIRKQSVKTLDQLHRSRDYDRIIVVAHSLGTAVAYDMLRAYYSRICDQISIKKEIHDPQFEIVDDKDAKTEVIDEKKCAAMRAAGRQLIEKLAADSKILADTARQDQYKPAIGEEVDAWLVTDFVTLGSPLTHARYFMVQGKDAKELDSNFEGSVREREFPTCPPRKLDGDGCIAFKDPNTQKLRLHHGGTFGMTRWTNLFFPITNIFWGDAIGGPVNPVFGDCVKDVIVSTKKAGGAGFFTHVAYWKTDCKDLREAPHLQALIDAIDLHDGDKLPPAAKA